MTAAIVLVLLLAAVAVLVGTARFARGVRVEVARIFARGADERLPEGTVAEEDLAGLPEPVRRYLRFTGVVGKRWVRYARLKQRGRFRAREEGAWMPIEAEEYFSVDEPGLLWYARARPAPLLTIQARDMLLGGQGNIRIKLLGVVSLADESGYELDQGVMLRYLSELIWAPTALLGPYVTWEAVDDSSARAHFTLGERQVSGVFHFDDEGKLTTFVAERYREVDGRYVLTRWSTPISAYGELGGFMLPSSGQAVWHLETGELRYADLEITAVQYDVPNAY